MIDYANIPTALLLPVSMLFCLTGGSLANFYSKRRISDGKDRFLYCVVTQTTSMVVLFILSGFSLKCSLYTVLLALVFGTVTMLQSFLTLNALAIGPWSYTSSIVSSLSTVITSFSGFLFWNERLSAMKVAGIVLMLVCVTLAVSKGSEKKASIRWLLFTLAAAGCSACVGLIQKIHQTSPHKAELSQFLIIAFFCGAVVSLVSYLRLRRSARGDRPEGPRPPAARLFPFFAGMVAAGACIAFNNEFNLYLSGAMDSSVFFPIVNGGGLMLNIVTSTFLFREKMNARQWIGVLLGIVAVLLLCIK